MPTRTKVPFVRMHEQMLARIQGLRLNCPNHVASLAVYVEFRHCVPGKHRPELIAAINAQLKVLRSKDKSGAKTAAMTSLRRLKAGLQETVDGDGKTVAERAASANGTADTHRDSAVVGQDVRSGGREGYALPG